MTKSDLPKNRRILIIDDNTQIHDDYRKILNGTSDVSKTLSNSRAALFGDKPAGVVDVDSFELDSAYQGQEGLELVCRAARDQRPYAMAFIDIRMPPGWDGITTVKHIWEEYPQLEVVLCTAYSDYSWNDMIDQLGQTDRLLLLKKPFDNIEVRQLAAALTEKWSLTRQAERQFDQLEEMVQERTMDLSAANEKLKVEVQERIRAEELLKEKDEQLRQSQKMEAIGTLAGGVAHEFNNLLQAIQGYTSFALDEIAPASQAHQDLERSIGAANRAEALTRQLLAFSRQERLDRVDMNPNDIVHELVSMVKPIIGEQIELRCDLNEDLHTICADRAVLQQVLINMCINARDAMADGGCLIIKTAKVEPDDPCYGRHCGVMAGEYVMLAVTDTGIGMPAEVAARVFEPFFTTKEVGQGTGLGLSIAHGVIEQHQGIIEVESVLNEGTTFRIFLPAVRSAEEASAVFGRQAERVAS